MHTLVQVELRQLQVARLCNLQINLRTVHYGHRKSRPLHNGGLIRANKTVCRGILHGVLQQSETKTLGSLRLHHERCVPPA